MARQASALTDPSGDSATQPGVGDCAVRGERDTPRRGQEEGTEGRSDSLKPTLTSPAAPGPSSGGLKEAAHLGVHSGQPQARHGSDNCEVSSIPPMSEGEDCCSRSLVTAQGQAAGLWQGCRLPHQQGCPPEMLDPTTIQPCLSERVTGTVPTKCVPTWP